MKVKVVNWVLRRFFEALCRIDYPELRNIPFEGPLILVGNHTNFLEAPVLLPHLEPRKVYGLAKIESWNNPLFHFLFDMWEAIPIERGMVDREAFNRSVQVLEQGNILAVFPEGTRSYSGGLLQGKPGIVALALRSKAPLMPVAFYGHHDFWNNIKHLRRTPFHICVGKPFRIDTGGEGLDRDARQAVTDEIMYKVAELLPEEYWGYYKDVRDIQYKYVKMLG